READDSSRVSTGPIRTSWACPSSASSRSSRGSDSDWGDSCGGPPRPTTASGRGSFPPGPREILRRLVGLPPEARFADRSARGKVLRPWLRLPPELGLAGRGRFIETTDRRGMRRRLDDLGARLRLGHDAPDRADEGVELL